MAEEHDDDPFVCERCDEETDDVSYQPLCPDCYHETHQDEYDDE